MLGGVEYETAKMLRLTYVRNIVYQFGLNQLNPVCRTTVLFLGFRTTR